MGANAADDLASENKHPANLSNQDKMNTNPGRSHIPR